MFKIIAFILLAMAWAWILADILETAPVWGRGYSPAAHAVVMSALSLAIGYLLAVILRPRPLAQDMERYFRERHPDAEPLRWDVKTQRWVPRRPD